MNYKKVYDSIILNAKYGNRIKLRSSDKGYIYYERHHIIPICIGGSNEEDNLVLLTAREHFLAHKLLVEIYPENSKIFWAFHRMAFSDNNGNRNIKISSREYLRLKILSSGYLSKLHKGKIISQKQIEFLKKRNKGSGNPMFGKISGNRGKTFSDEVRNKISQSLKGRKFTEGHKKNISLCKRGTHIGINNPNFGNKMSEESKKIISERHKGNKYSVGRKYSIITCPHCLKSGGELMMKRWHFDNCKLNNINLGKIFILNGSGGCGKDTLVDMISSEFDGEIINVRSSDEVKRVAKILGWDGNKDDKGRRFLAELMNSVKQYNDGIFNYWCKFIANNSKKGNVIFLHVREPEEIYKYVKQFNCKTILVRRDKIEVPNNNADLGVLNFSYDIIIDNNGSLEELRCSAIDFIVKELN